MSSPSKENCRIPVTDTSIDTTDEKSQDQGSTHVVIADLETETTEAASEAKCGPSLLIGAATAGDVDLVQELLAAGVPVDAQDQDGLSALAMAAICGHEKVVDVLQDAGASTDALHADFMALKYYAGDSFLHNTVLEWTILHEKKTLLKALLLAGVPLEGDMGRGALCAAIWRGDMHIINMLLDAKAHINTSDADARSPLRVAAEKGRMDILNILLDAGAVQNYPSSVEEPAFMVALKKGHNDIAKLLLLRFPASVNMPDREGLTPLAWAVDKKQVETAQMLIDAGAKLYPERLTKLQFDILNTAVDRDSIELVNMLLAAKEDQNLYASDQSSALINASIRGNVQIVKELLSARADTEI